jgi:hypothetical protein
VQLPPVHPTLPAPVGVGHGLHRVPQEFGLVFEAQTPLQLCEPVGHVVPQAAVASMHTPLQSLCVPGQVPVQAPAVQIAVPPVIEGQGVQEVSQLAASVSFMHLPVALQ